MDHKEILISVIIPIFNAEKYLEECLKSVVSCQIENMEIICVDDGSTDKSLDILLSFQKRDSRIKIIKQNNLHAGIARNVGLKESSGKWIHFLDSDDYISEDAYAKWIPLAEELEVDVCISMHENFNVQTGAKNRKKNLLNGEYMDKSNLLLNPHFFLYNTVAPWNKIYKREFLLKNEIFFDNLICANDRFFYFQVLDKARMIGVVDECMVHYRQGNENSLVGVVRQKNYECHFRAYEESWEIFKYYPQEIRKMFVDITMKDFFAFYNNSCGTIYENEIADKLRKYFETMDFSDIDGKLLSYSWGKDFIDLSYHTGISYKKLLNDRENSEKKLKDKTRECEQILELKNSEIFRLEKLVNEIYNSNSCKIGRMILWPARKFKDWVMGKRRIEVKQNENPIVEITDLHLAEIEHNPRIIVSFTSYPGRIKYVHNVVKSLMRQKNVKPDKIVLWLASEEFPLKELDLPNNLLELQKYGLEIEWCENLLSYKKLIPALKKYPNDIIVTVDDDAYYSSRWLEKLYNSYLFSDKVYIHCHRITKFFKPIDKWNIVSASKSVYTQPTFLHKLVGVGGVLYPPHIYEKNTEFFDYNIIQRIAPTNDDLWFWLWAVMNGVRIKSVNDAIPCPHILEGTQAESLSKINDQDEKLFWKDFYAILKQYPCLEKILDEEYRVVHQLDLLSRIPTEYKTEEYWKNLNTIQRKYELMNWYSKATKEYLDLENPRTFNEKIQWLKLYDQDPLKTILADKYRVRDWVKNQIGEEYLIPLLGVWNAFDEIDFSRLPEKFVLKTNHGSGWNEIVNDKGKMDYYELKEKFDGWIEMNFGYKAAQELHYCQIPPKIIAEELIDGIDDLCDYKFLCFNGKVKYVWVDSHRFEDHRRDLFDIEWSHLDVIINTEYPNSDICPEKPKNLDEMINIAKKLCQGFTHVRVDLYSVQEKIYFGEMTFTSGNGAEKIIPTSFNYKLGELIDLSNL